MFTYQNAIITTKAYPFHLGHVYLIRSALAAAEVVTVCLVHKEGEQPVGLTRANWILDTLAGSVERERLRVLLVDDIQTNDDDPESSVTWATYTQDIYKELDWSMPDVVVSSEDYGPRWAAAMGIDHIMVDRSRTAYPISGTLCRADPYANWHYLPPAVRAHYAIRVAIVGPESTGKTTLARELSQHYNTSWVPEYGRLYVEKNTDNINDLDDNRHRLIFPMIMREQPRMEDQLAREANRILICDTDLITTDIWYDVWQTQYRGDNVQRRLKELAASRHYHLYLLSVPEGTDWVDDGLRDQGNTREWFTWEFRKRLADHGDPVVELASGWDERFYKAVDHINRIVRETGTSWEPPIPVHAPSGIGSFFLHTNPGD